MNLRGSEWVLVGPRAFKACVGRFARPGWVRFPHVPASFGKAARPPGRARRGPSSLWIAVVLCLLAGPVIAVAGDEEPSGRFDSPMWVMMRSAVVPGWGQLKNGSYLRALVVIGLEAAFFERLYFENRMVREYRDKAKHASDESLVAFYQSRVDRHKGHRRDFIWWTSVLIGLSMGDAYVDAHLKQFDVRLQVEPDMGSTEAPDPGVRLGLSLSF